ncbi:MAG: hypothetical protein WCG84_04900, partial [Candidatus Moraniibacteriota bacterium]
METMNIRSGLDKTESNIVLIIRCGIVAVAMMEFSMKMLQVVGVKFPGEMGPPRYNPAKSVVEQPGWIIREKVSSIFSQVKNFLFEKKPKRERIRDEHTHRL